MLSLNEITRDPMWSHLSRMSVGSGEGSLRRLVPIRGLGGIVPLSEGRVEMRGNGSTAVVNPCFEFRSPLMLPRLVVSEVERRFMVPR